MAWYRRCSWCGGSGHNRRGCPTRPPESKERDQKYYQNSIYGRAKASCSYCGDTEHRRPKCAKLPLDRENWYKAEESLRRAFRNKLVELGVCKGVLIRQAYRPWDNETVDESSWNYLLIDSIDLYEISQRGINWVFRCKNAKDLSLREHAMSPDCVLEYVDKTGQNAHYDVKPYRMVEVLGAADPSIVESEIPLTWVTDRASMRLPEEMEDRSKKKSG